MHVGGPGPARCEVIPEHASKSDLTKRPKIVVVNDDPVQLKLLGATLAKENWEAHLFTGAEATLEAMSKLDSCCLPDLIISDLHMPGIDGWHFCRLLRSPEFLGFNKVPILVTSATYAGADIANISSGLGANAFLSLPIAGGLLVEQVRTLLAGERTLGLPRALLVDDDTLLLAVLRKAFEANGHEVTQATTKRGAIEAIAQNRFDLAVMDFHLPDGKGDEILAELRASQPGCACLLMTSDTTPHLALKWVKAGASAYLLKPFEPSYLLELCASARREQSHRSTEALLELRTRELQQREELFRTVADSARDWELWIGPNEELYYLSPSCERITGYSREEFLSDRDLYRRITHPEDLALLADHCQHISKEDEASVVFRIFHRDGSIRWMEHICHPVLGVDEVFQGHRISNRDITKRREMEEKLRESDARFRLIAENTSDGILCMDAEGRISYVSPAYLTLLGYDETEEIGRTPEAIFEIVHLEDRDELFTRIRNAVAEKRQSLIYSYRAKHKDGRYIWREDHARFTYQADGSYAGCNVICRDITEFKRAEETLRTVFASMEQSPVSILITNKVGDIQYVNPAFTKITGYELEAVRGMNPRLLKSGLHSEDFYREIWQKLEAGQTWVGELHNKKKNGEVFIEWATISPVRDDGGKVIGYVAVKEDVTERQRSEQALRKSEAQTRALVNAIPDLVFINRRDGEFLDFRAPNPESLILPPDGFLHRKASDVLPEPLGSTFMKAYEDAIENASTVELTYSVPIGDTERYFEARVVPMLDDLVLTIVRDITTRVRSDEQNHALLVQLQQSQKMDSLGRLAGGVAHDMNNVLAAILGLATANIGAQPPGSKGRFAFETIIRATERGGELVKSLLRFAHQAKAEERVLDLNEIVNDQVRLLERTTLARVRTTLDLAENLQPILGDSNAIAHALINLCVNAVDAMPDGGSLTLRTRNISPDWVEVCVEDTGEGIPKAILDRILDPFFTTKEIGKGTGLGLSMVYSTVKAHHGQLDIQSEVGLGTSVVLRFPAREVTQNSTVLSNISMEETPSISLNVLLIDDDDLVRMAVSEQLSALGCMVTTADSGEAALTALEVGPVPDLIILDMHMPGLGGRGTLPRIRAKQPSLNVLLATGRVEQATMDLIKGDSYTTLLSKPFSLEGLRTAIQAVRKD